MIEFEGKTYSEEDFLQLYMDQKVAENDAKEKRVNMEMKLLENYGDQVEEDKLSKQFKIGRYTVSIKRNITYKLTDYGWDLIWGMKERERPLEYKYSHTKGKEIPFIAVEEIMNETKPTISVVYK